jgi:hypothetical protein
MEFTCNDPAETPNAFECRGVAEKKWPIIFAIPASLLPEIGSYAKGFNTPEGKIKVIQSLFRAKIKQAIEKRVPSDKMELGQLHRREIAGLFSDVRAAQHRRSGKWR